MKPLRKNGGRTLSGANASGERKRAALERQINDMRGRHSRRKGRNREKRPSMRRSWSAESRPSGLRWPYSAGAGSHE